jgi:uncharacterized protein
MEDEFEFLGKIAHYEGICQTTIEKTQEYVKKELQGESSHDWWHILRVYNLGKKIAREEGAELFIVETATLLHDIADWKFHDGDENIGPQKAYDWLIKQEIEEEEAEHVKEIIQTMSFKGAGFKTSMKTLEGKVVQDADRLDAIGAIGIARTFAYGGLKNREIYNPDQPPATHQTKEEYMSNESHTINHFHEKLLLLKDLMNTETAKKIAEHRHSYMQLFLREFHREWNGED